MRQRVDWVTGWDTSVPESTKPPEIEMESIERDVTDFIQDFTRQHQREALSAEATFQVINERGNMTPSNTAERIQLGDGGRQASVRTLFGEGNEIQLYRIPDAMYLQDVVNKTNWIPRFRGVIHAVTTGVSEGSDMLEVVAGDVLSRTPKRAFSASWSPIVRTGSFIPGNSFFNLTRMGEALAIFRKVNGSSVMIDTQGSRVGSSITEPGMIPANLLASLIFWDREDYYLIKHNKYIFAPYFSNPKIVADGEFTDPTGGASIPLVKIR
ncbi:MAG: hypothetical protein MZW92_31445 [Comamonadaceae bacterium]|nr:hypothetical protein [Comamonadaceae bacterium]